MKRFSLKLGRLVAQRDYNWRYKRKAGTLHVRIGSPRLNPRGNGEWVCAVEMTGGPADFSTPHPLPVYGVDAFQTLQLALRFIHGELAVRVLPLQLTWFDQSEDLGFDGIQMFPGVTRVLRRIAKSARAVPKAGRLTRVPADKRS